MDDGLVLRDIHLSSAPPWWPPAPGWWWLAAALLLLVAGLVAWRLHRLQRRRKLLAFFDAETAAADPAGTVAAISSLLRRAARRREPDGDRLEGDAWLAFLDQGQDPPRFDGVRGELLLDGAYRPQPDPGAVADLRLAARARFVEWMERR